MTGLNLIDKQPLKAWTKSTNRYKSDMKISVILIEVIDSTLPKIHQNHRQNLV